MYIKETKFKKRFLIFFAFFLMIGCVNPGVKKFTKTINGLIIQLNNAQLQVSLKNEQIVHVQYSTEKPVKEHPGLAVIDTVSSAVKFDLNEDESDITIFTSKIKVICNKKSGKLSFKKINGDLLLSEGDREIKPVVITGENTFSITQRFNIDSEGIFGLGQHQQGDMNMRGKSVTLAQKNTSVGIPVIVSSKNYGILWDNPSTLKFKEMNNEMSVWSEVGDGINYYFIAGENLDEVVSGYRQLTGKAPLYSKWAYGLFQSKEHYNTQHEVDSVVNGFRSRHIPMDVIVQDWFYWNPLPWGSHYFDRLRYPDPVKMINDVHKANTKIIISVWSKFAIGSPNRKEMEDNNCLLPPIQMEYDPSTTRYYDAHSKKARELYWKQVHDSLFVKGIDGWWQDASEPEIGDMSSDSVKMGMNNELGSGARYLNSYPLMTTTAMFEGQRKTTSDKRVYILTRSAYAGQQRNAATTWSGDITASWEVFSKQIPAGINFCYSGIPYWTTDAGAFFVNYIGGNKNDSYKELFVRWFQFAAFCPIFRTHGTNTPREMWCFGQPGTWAYDALLKIDKLRYRLMPYIYSLGWKITNDNYTMMRGLAFDFASDKNVYNIADQYMFGPAFLVNPVTKPMYYPDAALGLGEMIPSSCLYSNDDKQGGLTGDYFAGQNFEKKVATRVDSKIEFDWGLASPFEGLSSDHFSVRWTGKIMPQYSGEYTFGIASDDGTRLWIDNKLLVDDWTQHATEYRFAKMKLEANKKYDIKLEYLEVIGQSNVMLKWGLPDFVKKKKSDEVKKERQVYFPEDTNWYDFWTGETTKGGVTKNVDAPIDIIPLFVKAGSIVPMGPFLEYATEKPADPIELRIYPGADGIFILYEDENDNYNYENGQYATIGFKWIDQDKTITIEDRKGSFKGMINKRKFNIVVVSKNHGTGLNGTENPDKTVEYTGKQLIMKF